jgi:VWFA-related protein
MALRFKAPLAWLLAVLISTPMVSQVSSTSSESKSPWSATVQVLVRDSRGAPVAGLGPGDFVLSEGGVRDEVLAVRSIAATPPDRTIEPSLPQSVTPQTSVLLVLAPMSASGRNAAITGLLKFLDAPVTAGWTLALLDDAGRFTSFTNAPATLRGKLQELAAHVSPPQYIGGSWTTEVDRAIQILAIRPGRHAILFASDFESNVAAPEARNLWLLRIGPSAFVGAAVRAQAAMYAVEASGGRIIVPLGGAESQYVQSGQDVAETMNLQFLGAAHARSDFLYAAQETGGIAARDVEEALADIAANAGGYYQITFRPNLEESDGAWHPVSVSVPGHHVRIRGPKYYLAPSPEDRQRMPPEMLKVLEKRTETARLGSAAHVWLFPDAEDAHMALMAADFFWNASEGRQSVGRRVQIFAQLVDESLGQVAGSWLSEQEWTHDTDRVFSVHWQRETPLYPGSYTLRVIAFDTTSGEIGGREFAFAIYPVSTPAFRLSDVVVASRCLNRNEIQGRANLLDPLLSEGCLLAPSAAGTFSTAQTPTIMVRIYTPDRALRQTILKKWKAFVSIGDGPRIPLSITEGDIRGMVASGKLDLAKPDLKRGANPIMVTFETTLTDGKKHSIALSSQLTVTP